MFTPTWTPPETASPQLSDGYFQISNPPRSPSAPEFPIPKSPVECSIPPMPSPIPRTSCAGRSVAGPTRCSERPYICITCKAYLTTTENRYCMRCYANPGSSEYPGLHKLESPAQSESRCVQCPSDSREPIQHWTSDTKEHAYCVRCNLHFPSRSELCIHYLEDVGHAPFTTFFRETPTPALACSDSSCTERFKTEYEMRIHYKYAHSQAFVCPAPGCRMRFLSQVSMLSHHSRSHENTSSCKSPSRAAASTSCCSVIDRRESCHWAKSAGDRDQRTRDFLVCPAEGCHERFEDPETQLRHMISSHVCCWPCSNECGGKFFRDRKELEAHIREGLPGHAYCWVCQIMFGDVGRLESHFNDIHGGARLGETGHGAASG